MGLKDWLRGKPEEDPILGGLGQTGSSLQPQPAPMQQAPMMGIGTQQAQPAPAQSDPVARLERLASLRDSGAITDDEFTAAKARLLGP